MLLGLLRGRLLRGHVSRSNARADRRNQQHHCTRDYETPKHPSRFVHIFPLNPYFIIVSRLAAFGPVKQSLFLPNENNRPVPSKLLDKSDYRTSGVIGRDFFGLVPLRSSRPWGAKKLLLDNKSDLSKVRR